VWLFSLIVILPNFFFYAPAQLLLGPLHQIPSPVIRNTQCLTYFDTTCLLGEPHPESCLCSLSQSREAIPQRFDCRVAGQIFACPTIPYLVQQARFTQRLHFPLFPVHGHQQIVGCTPQVAGRCGITVLHEIIPPQHTQESFLRQIVGC
jgi:hypothetical protein